MHRKGSVKCSFLPFTHTHHNVFIFSSSLWNCKLDSEMASIFVQNGTQRPPGSLLNPPLEMLLFEPHTPCVLNAIVRACWSCVSPSSETWSPWQLDHRGSKPLLISAYSIVKTPVLKQVHLLAPLTALCCLMLYECTGLIHYLLQL